MKGHYSIVRCVPDPTRGETFNVGIAVWAKKRFVSQVDRHAARRAASSNPHLAADAFDNVESLVFSQLHAMDPIDTRKFQKMRKHHREVPVMFSQPQFVNLYREGLDPLSDALDRLMDRLIRSRQTRSVQEEEDTLDPVVLLENRISTLIAEGLVQRKHVFRGAKTGYDRRVDFSYGSLALDVLRIDVKDEEAAIRRADAEAFKIYDVKDNVQVREFYVFPFMGREEQVNLLGDPIEKAIASVGGKIVKDLQGAENLLRPYA